MGTPNLPLPQSPFVISTGALSYDGYQYLLKLLAASLPTIATATVERGLAATGLKQVTALLLSSQWSEVNTVPAGSGVLLSETAGQTQKVFNQGANPLKVYPPPDWEINNFGPDAPYSLAAGASKQFFFLPNKRISA